MNNAVKMNLANVEVTVNGMKLTVPVGCSVLQACELANVEIPRFCYHERLSIAGNCRMCLVEIEGGPPKPVASCAMPVASGMVIHTNTPRVKSAREGVMEFLLLNHPLDCPICDQGGECDLQDQAFLYGKGASRSEEMRRAVPRKDFGPLISAEMTRCIHCTRCVRFLSDVAGIDELVAIGRGEDTEIATYIGSSVTSELSGNIIDLCPVGALTAKPHAFMARSWEMVHYNSIDVLDAVGSSIRVDVCGDKVLRVLPRLNEDVNEEWISDKTRFACDGLRYRRIDRPYVKFEDGLKEVSWEVALGCVAEKLSATKPEKVAVIAGDLIDCESMLLMKKMMNAIGVKNFECRQDGSKLDNFGRSSYIFNTTISGIDDSSFCLLVGTDVRFEAPIINARIRKRHLMGDFKVASIGKIDHATYPIDCLGEDLSILKSILDCSHPVHELLLKSKNPMIIVGQDALSNPDGLVILYYLGKIAEKFGLISDERNNFNVLHKAASRVGALDLGYIYPGGIKSMIESSSVLYLLGADEINVKDINPDAFVIYQGHHGDLGAATADVVLPGAAYTEKDGTYVNTEGRAQRAYAVVSPPGMARRDVNILFDLAKHLGVALDIGSFEDLRRTLCDYGTHFRELNCVVKEVWQGINAEKIDFSDGLFLKNSSQNNFYTADVITRASKTMKQCKENYDRFNCKNY